MLHSALLIPPSAAFWAEVARALLNRERNTATGPLDLSGLRVVVPAFAHARLLNGALANQLNEAFIPPRITTMSAWLAWLPPDPSVAPATAGSERLMLLYAELRQHAWLKKLFHARRNTDLLPLAQTLLRLSDELTQALLPAVLAAPAAVEDRWQAALTQLSPSSSVLLSDEAQLVWSVWKSQLDGNDPCAARYEQMKLLAERATDPLVWISPTAPDAFEQAFLAAYGIRQTVLPIMLDWRAGSVDAAYETAWSELLEGAADPAPDTAAPGLIAPDGLVLYAATSLEDEAQCGAQTIIDWLASGKSDIAIVVQDRIVARRMRALLERAQVFVADETGWKLSTTRAAAAIAAWFDVVSARAETAALLDLLKSPFLFAATADKPVQVMAIELALRNANVPGGWDAVTASLAKVPAAHQLLQHIARQAALFAGRKTVQQWIGLTKGMLEALGMRAAMEIDAAGVQVLAMLDGVARECQALTEEFSFAEWRAFISQQLEETSFAAPAVDDRVAMLPLNGAHLRPFEAVLVVGADADHLPSRPDDALFFANAVRRELGLATRESRQRQQLRDFAELLAINGTVVLSWQAHRNGEPNPASVWIERLQLALEHGGAQKLLVHQVRIPRQNLASALPARPAPAAPHLLPRKLSASGYNSLVACPYQFFATRMLGLSGLVELSDMPEKRDYGDWLHRILSMYHANIRDSDIGTDAREGLLRNISDKIFGDELNKNGAALGYYARWVKAIPAYLAWANAHETAGWQFMFGEQWREKTLTWTGGAIALHGRIDRIDRNAAGEHAVLDYKTRDAASLRARLRQNEDHQLAFYGLLLDQPAAAAYFVALEPKQGKTGAAEAVNYAGWQHALSEQIGTNMQAIAQGAELPATGIETVCQYCDVRGLCRKGAW